MTLIGSTTAIFVIRLSQALAEQVDVSWATRDGVARAGVDYEAANGVVTFLPGETEKQIQVTVFGQDVITADNLNFFIDLTPPTNAVLGTQMVEAVIQLVDQDGATITTVVAAQGRRGLKGDPGMSAYEHAVLMGYTGTVEQWMNEVAGASQAATRAETAATAAASSATRAENYVVDLETAVIDPETKKAVASRIYDASGKTQQELNTNQQTINSSAKSVNALVAGLKLDGTDETTAVTTLLNGGFIIEVPKGYTLKVDQTVFANKQDKYWGEGFVQVINSTDLSYLKPQPLPPYPNGYRQGYFESLKAGGNKSTAIGHGVVVNRVGYPEISGYTNSSGMASYGSGDVVGSYVDVRAPMATTLTGTTFTANNVVATSLTSAANIKVGDTIRTATDSAQGNAVWLGWVTAVDFNTKTITVDGWYKRYTTTAGTPTNGISVITPDVTSVFGQNIVVFGKTGDSAEIFRGSEIGILIDTDKPTPRLIEGMLVTNLNGSVQGGSTYAASGNWKIAYRSDVIPIGFQHLGSPSVDGYTGLVHQSVFGRKSNILKGMANDGVTTFYTMDMYGKQSHERVIATTLTGGDKNLYFGGNTFNIIDTSTVRNITINPDPTYSIGTIWEFIAVGSQTVTITAGTTTTVLNYTVNGYNRMRIYYDGSFRVLELCRTVGSLGYASTFSAVQTFSSGIKVGTASYLNGAGSPEGVVTAPVGSLYTRTDGGAGTTLYVKESGTGNTGWVAK